HHGRRSNARPAGKENHTGPDIYTGPGGGMYTGPDANPFKAIFPPWPLFAEELRKMGMHQQADLIQDALNSIGYTA
ncbi:MAG TPA: hypothetical protein VFN29_00800, partial [Chiayiivirga sp.]|nr:hypothetical protein [Chiayiivirga sp.]